MDGLLGLIFRLGRELREEVEIRLRGEYMEQGVEHKEGKMEQLLSGDGGERIYWLRSGEARGQSG